MIGDADRRRRKALVVPLDPVAIIVAGAGKADPFPGRHVLVAAVDRVGEEAVLRVLEDELEELGAVAAGELDRAVLEPGDDVVLVLVGGLGERLAAEFFPAIGGARAERLAIMLRRRERHLLAVLLAALVERPARVLALVAAGRAGELAIDEH